MTISRVVSIQPNELDLELDERVRQSIDMSKQTFKRHPTIALQKLAGLDVGQAKGSFLAR